MSNGFRQAYGNLRRKAEAYDVLEAALREIARSTRFSTINPDELVPTGDALLAQKALKKAGTHAPGAFDGRTRQMEEALQNIASRVTYAEFKEAFPTAAKKGALGDTIDEIIKVARTALGVTA